MSQNNLQLESEVLPNVPWLSSPADLWNLFHLTTKENSYIYGMTKDVIRRQRNKKRELQKKGRISIVPNNPQWEQDPSLDNEKQRANARRKNIAPTVGQKALDLVNIQVPYDTAWMHEELRKQLEAHGDAITSMRFSEYQQGAKNDDGEYVIHDLKANKVFVKFDREPKWFPITPVTLEKPLKRDYEKAKNPTDWQTTVIIPDVQYPCADEKAIEVFLSICRTLKPDNFIQLGDLLDLSAHGRFIDNRGDKFASNTNLALTQALDFFRELRLINDGAKIIYLEGNHERRVPKDVLGNHGHNYDIKPADDPEGPPLVSVPRMVGLDSVDVEYLPGYPNNRYWINDNLQVIHGNVSGRNEMKRVITSEKVSTIFGHTHRLGVERQTINFRDGGAYRRSYNAGTLSRIDRTVPGTNTGYDLDGNPVNGAYDNWQLGFYVITHNDQQFKMEEVEIDPFDGYSAMFRGKLYAPKT